VFHIISLMTVIKLSMEIFSIFMMVEIDTASCYMQKTTMTKESLKVKGATSQSWIHKLCETTCIFIFQSLFLKSKFHTKIILVIKLYKKRSQNSVEHFDHSEYVTPVT
jgi:hypothetical protein